MRILGNGLIARSLRPVAHLHQDVIAFATGVPDSATASQAAFERECDMLYGALEDARRHGLRLLYFSGGGAIYGRWADPAVETSPLEPRSAYGRHQLLCEAIIASAGIGYLVARLPNVVGEDANPAQLVPTLVRQVIQGRVEVQAHATRDLIDALDLATVIAALLDRAAERDTVNVASGRSVPVPLLVDEIARILGARPDVVTRPSGVAQRFSTAYLTAILGYNPFEGHDFRAILARHVPGLAEPATSARI
jgi:nucleoside-diphosphate-sugar epimerase